MERNFYLCGGVLVFLYLTGFTPEEAQSLAYGFLAAKRAAIIIGGLPAAMAMVFALFLLSKVGLFSSLYVIAKFVYEILKLFLCALALAALIFGLAFKLNLWLEASQLVFALYSWFYAAALSLLIFDFNYPLRKDLLAYSLLPLACLALVWAVGVILNFI